MNRFLDSLLALEGRFRAGFELCGGTGLAAAIALAAGLAAARGLSLWVMAGVAAVSLVACVLLAAVTRVLAGEPKLVFYHDAIVALLVSTLFLAAWGGPVLPYLDLVAVGLGVILACGRVGCALAGCCHGRPHSWGLRYGAAHVETGFTPYLVGVRLFPVQLLESVWVVAVTAAGIAFFVRGARPGMTFAWCMGLQTLGRFGFEFLRGDPDRKVWAGITEAQWLALVLACIAGAAGRGRAAWLPALFEAFWIGKLWVARQRKRDRTYLLLSPDHVREFVGALDVVLEHTKPCEIHLGCTSLGVRVTAGHVAGTAGVVHHYALSGETGAMAREEAGKLADLILHLRHGGAAGDLIDSGRGVFHLLVNAAERPTA